MKNRKLLKLFENKEKPEIVLQYIYDNVYELIKEMNEFIHYIDRDHHINHSFAYKEYYRELVNNNTDKSILYYFPNPRYSVHFSFKNFFVGVVGRILCNTEYLYGDPLNWDLAYYIDIEVNHFWIKQYMLLDNYNEFIVLDLLGDGPTVVDERRVIYRTIGEESEINFDTFVYRPLDVISRLEQRRNGDYFHFFDSNVEALLHDIYEKRRKDFQQKPLYLYRDEFEE